LVDRTRNFKSTEQETSNQASRFKQKNYEKNAPQARFCYKTKCTDGKIHQTKYAEGQNF